MCINTYINEKGKQYCLVFIKMLTKMNGKCKQSGLINAQLFVKLLICEQPQFVILALFYNFKIIDT